MESIPSVPKNFDTYRSSVITEPTSISLRLEDRKPNRPLVPFLAPFFFHHVHEGPIPVLMVGEYRKSTEIETLFFEIVRGYNGIRGFHWILPSSQGSSRLAGSSRIKGLEMAWFKLVVCEVCTLQDLIYFDEEGTPLAYATYMYTCRDCEQVFPIIADGDMQLKRGPIPDGATTATCTDKLKIEGMKSKGKTG